MDAVPTVRSLPEQGDGLRQAKEHVDTSGGLCAVFDMEQSQY